MSKKQDVRFALVPHAGCVCEQCLMIGSQGFHFTKPFSPHGGRNVKCKCEFMPGVKGKTKIEGYDPESIKKQWRTAREIRTELDLDEWGLKELFNTLGIESLENISADEIIDMYIEATAHLGKDVKATVENVSAAIRESFAERINHPTIRKSVDTSKPPQDIDGLNFVSMKKIERRQGGSADYSSQPMDTFGTLRDINALDMFAPSNFLKKGNEWRDLYAHDVLMSYGYSVRARKGKQVDANGKIIEGVSLVDIDLDGVMWEIKSPEEYGKRTIESQLRKALHRNFKNPYDEQTLSGMGSDVPPRVIINTKYVDVDDNEVRREIARIMQGLRIEEVIHISSSGDVYHFGRSLEK